MLCAMTLKITKIKKQPPFITKYFEEEYKLKCSPRDNTLTWAK